MAVTYYRPPSSFYNQAEQIFGPGFNYAPTQAALPAGGTPLALGAGSGQYALNAGLANQITADAGSLLPGARAAGGAFIPETQFASQLGNATGMGGLRGGLSTLKTGVKGAALPAIGAMLAGQAGGQLVEGLLPGPNDAASQAMGDIPRWAGTGAAVGSIVPGIGTLIGGLGGATAATAKNVLFGIDQPKIKVKPVGQHPTAMIVQTVQAMGLGKKAQHRAVKDYRKAYQLAAVGANGEKGRLQAANIALQSVMGDLQSQYQDKKQGGGGNSLEKGLASQALAAQFLGPILARQQASADALAGVQEAGAATLPAEYQNLARVQAANTRANQSDLAAAYASQIQAMPGQRAMEEKLARQKQMEQQAFAATLQQADQGGGTQTYADALKAAGVKP